MGHGIDHLTGVIDDIGTAADGDALTHGLTSDGERRNKAGQHQRYDRGKAQLKAAQHLGCNGCRGRAGNNAADVAHHIVADGADPLGVAQQHDALLRAFDLSRGHGVEGLFVGSGHSHAHNVKQDADEHDHQQNEKGHDHGALSHDEIGHQGNGRRDGDGCKENTDDPSAGLALLLFLIGFCQGSFS